MERGLVLKKLNYYNTRIVYDSRRAVLWRVLVEDYFQKYINPGDCVLELGAGYGDFINSVRASRRVAVDIWKEMPNYLDEDVNAIIGSVTDLIDVENKSVDFVFASNLFEHLSIDEFNVCMSNLKKKMKNKATLNIIQPNFRHAYREYFDDYTHKTIYTHIGLTDLLMTNGFKIIACKPKFLPLTIKSRFPIHPVLIKLYLRSPIKIWGKQMLIRAINEE